MEKSIAKTFPTGRGNSWRPEPPPITYIILAVARKGRLNCFMKLHARMRSTRIGGYLLLKLCCVPWFNNITFRKMEDDVASTVRLSVLERKEMRNLMDELDASRLGPNTTQPMRLRGIKSYKTQKVVTKTLPNAGSGSFGFSLQCQASAGLVSEGCYDGCQP